MQSSVGKGGNIGEIDEEIIEFLQNIVRCTDKLLNIPNVNKQVNTRSNMLKS